MVVEFISALLIGFLAGGGVITPNADTFDIGGVISFSIFETSEKEITPLSSLLISGKVGYAPLDEVFIYGTIGVKNISPIDPTPTLNHFGLGMKFLLLDKSRDVNLTVDSSLEISPFTIKTQRKFPNNMFWQVAPTLSFKTGHSIVYIGGGYRDFFMRLENGTYLRARPDTRFFLIVGGDYFLNPRTYLTLEIHSFGRSSIFGGISHRF